MCALFYVSALNTDLPGIFVRSSIQFCGARASVFISRLKYPPFVLTVLDLLCVVTSAAVVCFFHGSGCIHCERVRGELARLW